MSLSHEDALRLNILLSTDLQAVRIDESKMVVHALSEGGEAKVKLNPNCRHDKYLRLVRELLSGYVMESPGGYPVFLKRWTRMGQARDENLAQMLLLGEQEAVVAVVCAAGLTDELARRAWWVMPTAENARRMLERPAILAARMGKVLAEYLFEHLPFEDDPMTVVRTVRLILQGDLIDPAQRQALWSKGSADSVYRVGFLASDPESLPVLRPPRRDLAERCDALRTLSDEGNSFAKEMLRILSAPGQTFLSVVADCLRRAENQDIVTALFDIVAVYFSVLRPEGRSADATLEDLSDEAGRAQEKSLREGSPREFAIAHDRCPALSRELGAMFFLSGLGYGVLRPIFTRTSANGSLMRRKLEPVLAPLFARFALLLGAEHLEIGVRRTQRRTSRPTRHGTR
jgi:hypothetical protein